MRYQFVMLKDDGENPAEFVPVIQVACEAPDPTLEAQFLARVSGEVQAVVHEAGIPVSSLVNDAKGRPARALRILAVEDASTAPAGICVGLEVRSSMDLSLMLRYQYNMVIQAHHRAKNRRLRDAAKLSKDEREALMASPLEVTLRGVTFCYVDELPGAV